MVTLTINGQTVQVPAGTTILEAAEKAGIKIPTLCYLKDINEIAACRMCVVEVEGSDRLAAACDTPVEEGLVVHTNTPKVRKARRINMELLLSQHASYCSTCIRSGNCPLQKLANDLNIHEMPYHVHVAKGYTDTSTPLVRQASKCIKCMRCVQICEKVQTMGIWDLAGTGSRTTVDVSGNRTLKTSDCTFCGQCVTHCPTGALTARDDTVKVLDALADPEITTVVQIAPAVRVAWAESFGLTGKKAATGKMVAALRRLGFDYVFDTNFSADLTIMEEGSEFLERFTHRDRYHWPMFTSCCPGWVRFLKSQFPNYVDCLSTAKSPQQMFGAVAKTYFAEKIGVDPHRMFVVSIMPCMAKKSECALPTMRDACGDPDVDAVLTTREMDRLFRSDNIQPGDLPEEAFDSPLGTGTGAAVVFGATGGVMDAALRSAYYLVTGENPDPDAFTAIRGNKPWKEAVFSIPGAGEIRVAVVSGLGNTRKLMKSLESGQSRYDFVEVMACPGGCAGGGGQPIHDGEELAGKRGDALWKLDQKAPIRFSHENPEIQTLYQEFLERPLGKKSHHLLHTDHTAWEVVEKGIWLDSN
ncbi:MULTISPECIES: NADH-dependent [FeFe] hydrogenase, group A6 [Oscillospiraceae]|uniref:NADH-dependent [FeFe] hydrogenase, group A6 n=1 Tax=Oscillospiraceae TaxID=216572 RepID=UPI001FA21CDD|nr:NADH-dependent [FeFe] hydrogenase, group A6 [Oscillibacter sp.]MBS6355550.1 [FeFe] hydrogenase, group A [Oscillibacter sp.]HJB52319.1 [FeFe] hydrogenase, group A [Candidatus Oscillibacter pullicola]